MPIGYWETLATLNADGTALTAAARASLTQGAAATGARYTMNGNKLRIGDQLKVIASGRISCAVTTPGTARFDLSFGGTANFDTLAMNLNIVAKTNVGWFLEVIGTVRAIGTTANIFWMGKWDSEAVIASPTAATGGSGGWVVPYNTAPVIGPNFDSTIDQLVDLQFTQTVATGSCTLHQYNFSHLTSTGFG